MFTAPSPVRLLGRVLIAPDSLLRHIFVCVRSSGIRLRGSILTSNQAGVPLFKHVNRRGWPHTRREQKVAATWALGRPRCSQCARRGSAIMLASPFVLLLATASPALAYVGGRCCAPHLALRRHGLSRRVGTVHLIADEKALSEEAEVWRLREQMVRRSYELIYNFKEDDRVRFEELEAEGDRDDGEATRSAFVASAAAVVVGALVLRIGGRAALVSALGLDLVAEMGIGDKIDQVVAYADALGVFAVAAFFAAWVVAKVNACGRVTNHGHCRIPHTMQPRPNASRLSMRQCAARSTPNLPSPGLPDRLYFDRARHRLRRHLRRRLRRRGALCLWSDARLACGLPAVSHAAAGGRHITDATPLGAHL